MTFCFTVIFAYCAVYFLAILVQYSVFWSAAFKFETHFYNTIIHYTIDKTKTCSHLVQMQCLQIFLPFYRICVLKMKTKSLITSKKKKKIFVIVCAVCTVWFKSETKREFLLLLLLLFFAVLWISCCVVNNSPFLIYFYRFFINIIFISIYIISIQLFWAKKKKQNWWYVLQNVLNWVFKKTCK